MAIYARSDRDLDGLIHHSDRGVQYLAIRYTERLAEAGVVNSRRQQRRFLRQCPGRELQRPLQDRADPPPRALEERRPRRMGHPHLRRLVQQPSHPQRDREDPAGRVRGELLPSDCNARTGVITDKRVCMKPGPIHHSSRRFISSIRSGERCNEPRCTCPWESTSDSGYTSRMPVMTPPPIDLPKGGPLGRSQRIGR